MHKTLGRIFILMHCQRNLVRKSTWKKKTIWRLVVGNAESLTNIKRRYSHNAINIEHVNCIIPDVVSYIKAGGGGGGAQWCTVCHTRLPSPGTAVLTSHHPYVGKWVVANRCLAVYSAESSPTSMCRFPLPLIYLFGVLRRFQYCTGHITTGSWKGRGNQYIQFVRVLYCKLPNNGKQLPAFPLEAVVGIEPRPQRWEARVLPLCHHGPSSALKVSIVV